MHTVDNDKRVSMSSEKVSTWFGKRFIAMKSMDVVSWLTYTGPFLVGPITSLIEKSWGLTVSKHRLDQLPPYCQLHISLESALHFV